MKTEQFYIFISILLHSMAVEIAVASMEVIL